MVTDLLHQHLD